ncbi:MAG: chemotaxis protein CheD [Spirochaetales bacterium]|nr:chemotaxis protein CheD [Spirochaetales bacterium]
MNTYFNNDFQRDVVVILPGEFAVSGDQVISTHLGTCIAVVLYSEKDKYGGMNHFMLPDPGQNRNILETDSGRYGINAMELLINGILKHGVEKKALTAKIFGGGHMFSSEIYTERKHIGIKNIEFAMEFLESEKIPIVAKDIGGYGGRKIFFFPEDGRIKLKRLKKVVDLNIFEDEYEKSLLKKQEKKKTNIFVFDD